jgi:hypothetical protein
MFWVVAVPCKQMSIQSDHLPSSPPQSTSSRLRVCQHRCLLLATLCRQQQEEVKEPQQCQSPLRAPSQAVVAVFLVPLGQLALLLMKQGAVLQSNPLASAAQHPAPQQPAAQASLRLRARSSPPTPSLPQTAPQPFSP